MIKLIFFYLCVWASHFNSGDFKATGCLIVGRGKIILNVILWVFCENWGKFDRQRCWWWFNGHFEGGTFSFSEYLTKTSSYCQIRLSTCTKILQKINSASSIDCYSFQCQFGSIFWISMSFYSAMTLRILV